MPTGQEIVDHAVALDLKDIPYIYGAEADLDNPHPRALDCSEMVEVVCHQARVRPFMPDGAVFQYRHCVNHDLDIEVSEAMKTPGALMFFFSDDPLETRPDHAHVVISRGNGKTWECRGKDYGCGSWDARGRFNYAALIPGVTYA